jgi:membrane-bound lytic murein transglycosylase D
MIDTMGQQPAILVTHHLPMERPRLQARSHAAGQVTRQATVRRSLLVLMLLVASVWSAACNTVPLSPSGNVVRDPVERQDPSTVPVVTVTPPLKRVDEAKPPTASVDVPSSIATPPQPTAAIPSSAAAPSTSTALPPAAIDTNALPTGNSTIPGPGPAPASTSEAATDPLQPEVPVNLEDRNARKNLWDRVRSGFAVPDFDDGLVRRAERYYAQRPEYVQRMTERGSRYLFHIVEEVQRRGLPTELALLPFVESAFNPEALSSASASGMWQFMPSTGRGYNLKQNVFRDDRRDVLASTRAALDYLTRLHKMFGDWHLALAAYNWGEGNVQRAIRRNVAAGLPARYEALRMPIETRFYIPKLQAIKNIVEKPERFALKLPLLENHPYFLAVAIDRDIDVDTAAKLAGLPVAEVKALNPQISRPVILAAGTPRILLPYDNAATFVRALPKHKGALASWTAWTVPSTMKSADAAKQAGMSDDQFRSVNNIPPRMLVKVGSTVLVPRSSTKQADVAAKVADYASLDLAHESPPMRRVVVKVGKKGDTVAALAKRHGVTVAQILQWNKLAANASLKPGSTIELQVPQNLKGGSRSAAAKSGAKRSVKAPAKAKVRAKGKSSSRSLAAPRR